MALASSDRQYTLYVSPYCWDEETRQVVDLICQKGLENIIKIHQVIDSDTWESLEAIRGERIKLPFLEVVFGCETDAILGYMGKKEIVEVFRTYNLI